MAHLPSNCKVCSIDGHSKLNTRLCLEGQVCVPGNVNENDWNVFKDMHKRDEGYDIEEWNKNKAGWCGEEANAKSVQHCVAAERNLRYCGVCSKDKQSEECKGITNGQTCVAIGNWDQGWYNELRPDSCDSEEDFPLITELGFCGNGDASSANGCFGFKPQSDQPPSPHGTSVSPHDTTESPPANPDAADNPSSASSTLCPAFIGLFIGAVMLFV